MSVLGNDNNITLYKIFMSSINDYYQENHDSVKGHTRAAELTICLTGLICTMYEPMLIQLCGNEKIRRVI